ncbi:MAG: hypothetical protein J6X18_17360 [Bacteroidales bacterium]|nr:hypothetical protein [Bacteroidales bacterium]MBP5725330.1 hypothetical protein [Bacteroidales bacterium]
MANFLYCYKMTHDTGFAPNPYHNVLTLATCKPVIRRCAKKDYWISGWASNVVQGKDKKYKDKAQKLIYLAKVSDVLSFEEYWEKYPLKKQPTKSIEGGKECFKSCGNGIVVRNDDISFCGDNIYEPDANDPSGFKQHKNAHHNEQNKAHDLSGKNVLVCEEFYYFGVENALEIKNKGFDVPRTKKFSVDDKEAKNVIDFVTKNYSKGLYPKKK